MTEFMNLWDGLVNWAAHGLVQTTWWQIVLVMLVLTHITIASVTIFLHRPAARSLLPQARRVRRPRFALVRQESTMIVLQPLLKF